jgi:hypothetical protein
MLKHHIFVACTLATVYFSTGCTPVAPPPPTGDSSLVPPNQPGVTGINAVTGLDWPNNKKYTFSGVKFEDVRYNDIEGEGYLDGPYDSGNYETGRHVHDYLLFQPTPVDKSKPLKLVLFLHGFGVYDQKYSSTISHFVKKGYTVVMPYYYQLPGLITVVAHGPIGAARSEVAMVKAVNRLESDGYSVVRNESGELKYAIVGHSAGAIVGARMAYNAVHPSDESDPLHELGYDLLPSPDAVIMLDPAGDQIVGNREVTLPPVVGGDPVVMSGDSVVLMLRSECTLTYPRDRMAECLRGTKEEAGASRGYEAYSRITVGAGVSKSAYVVPHYLNETGTLYAQSKDWGASKHSYYGSTVYPAQAWGWLLMGTAVIDYVFEEDITIKNLHKCFFTDDNVCGSNEGLTMGTMRRGGVAVTTPAKYHDPLVD